MNMQSTQGSIESLRVKIVKLTNILFRVVSSYISTNWEVNEFLPQTLTVFPPIS